MTLEDIKASLNSSTPNPVEVAGYGRESTHKGYLTHFLNTERWPEASTFLSRLLGKEVPRRLKSRSEVRLNKRSADVVVYETNANGEIGCEHIAIELKTDTVVHCDQLEAYAGKVEHSVAWCLGSSSVQSHGCNKHPVFGTDIILDALDSATGHSLPQFVQHWRDALKAEQLRKRFAIKAFEQQRESGIAPEEFGYRSERNLLTYVLDHLAHAYCDLKSKDRKECELRQLPHSSVLKLGKENKWNGSTWYFEFNDDSYYLKLWTAAPTNSPSAFAAEVRKLRERVESAVSVAVPGVKAVRRRLHSHSKSCTVMSWSLLERAPNSLEDSATVIDRIHNACEPCLMNRE